MNRKQLSQSVNLKQPEYRPLTCPDQRDFDGVLYVASPSLSPLLIEENFSQPSKDLLSPTVGSSKSLLKKKNRQKASKLATATDILRTTTSGSSRRSSRGNASSEDNRVIYTSINANDKENITTIMPEFGLKELASKAKMESNMARLNLIKSGARAVKNLPLVYLFSNPELRPYGIERAAKILLKPAIASTRLLLSHALNLWKSIQIVQLDDRQVGSIVIAKCFSNLLEKCMGKKFRRWSFVCSGRFAYDRLQYLEDAVKVIQRWWLYFRLLKREPWKRLSDAICVCLSRRRAIKHLIAFELKRKEGIGKLRKGIAKRRSLYFATRSIQRIFRWYLLRVKTTYRLIRSICARHIQRWHRMILYRPKKDLFIIRQVLKYGGYTRVFSKVPKKHLKLGKLASMNSIVSMIQKNYYISRGNFQKFQEAATRKADAAYREMLNEKVIIIQTSWRGHLWKLLMLSATLNNRARRIQRAFRAYQYRFAISKLHTRYIFRKASKIKKFMQRICFCRKLSSRFKIRKSFLLFLRCKQTLTVIKIQRCYRAHVAWLLWVKEQLRLFYEAQRSNAAVKVASLQRIQWSWRKQWRPNWHVMYVSHLDRNGERVMKRGGWYMKRSRFSKHILILFKNELRKKRMLHHRMALRIQVLFRKKMERKIIQTLRWKNLNARKIWAFVKSYLLKLSIYNRISAARRRQIVAASKIIRSIRVYVFYRKILIGFVFRKVSFQLDIFRNLAVTLIQRLVRRKLKEFYVPLRLVSRLSLKKKRALLHAVHRDRVFDCASRVCQKFGKNILYWNRIVQIVKIQRKRLLEWRKAKVLRKFAKWIICWNRYDRIVEEKYARLKAAAQHLREIRASNMIGRNWKRKHKELNLLKYRFKLRKKTIEKEAELLEASKKAIKERKKAEKEKRDTDEFLKQTIKASWKQGSDEVGRNYYYNYVTGDTCWDAPEDMVISVVDSWMKQIDARGNVYYYNQKSEQSSWLPPCVVCGEAAERWCNDCDSAFCLNHFEPTHITQPLPNPDFASHIWSLCVYDKDILGAGEIYCIECKKKTATRMCMTCWDAYCDQCFKLIHRVGALKSHLFMPYVRAKKGWICIKGKVKGDHDYYIHGTTGETTYDKPRDLMTDQERIYYTNFTVHKEAADKYSKQIEQLQLDLESATYSRDMLLFDSLNAKDASKRAKHKVESTNEVVQQAAKGTGGAMGFVGRAFETLADTAYRKKILSSDDRSRGQSRSAYIKNILDSASDLILTDDNIPKSAP